MREIRPSGSEGGARLIPRPYPYFSVYPFGMKILKSQLLTISWSGISFGQLCAQRCCGWRRRASGQRNEPVARARGEKRQHEVPCAKLWSEPPSDCG